MKKDIEIPITKLKSLNKILLNNIPTFRFL